MNPSSPRSPSNPLADAQEISFFNSTENAAPSMSIPQAQDSLSEEATTSFPQRSNASQKNGQDSGSESHTSSIYDFLVRDMMPKDEPPIDSAPAASQSMFEKIAGGYSDHSGIEPSAKKELPSEDERQINRANDGTFFSFMKGAKVPSGNVSTQKAETIGEDRDSLMRKIISNLNQSQDSHEVRTEPWNPPSVATNTIWNTFPGRAQEQSHQQDSAQAPSSFTNTLNPVVTKSQHVHPSQSFSAVTRGSELADAPQLPKATPAPLPTPPAKLSQSLTDQLMACENRASQQVDYSAASKRITKSPLDQIVTMGPKNAPTAGFTTQTVLSSFSFNLPSQEGSVYAPDGSRPSLSFPPLVVMEISPSTLYFLDTRSTPNDAISPTAVSDFLQALPQVTAYTLKLIASGGEKKLNELQIALLHCTFIVNPSKGPPPGVNEQLLRQQSQQFASTSPYNAPTSYHVIQFRSLISNVTYIPLPEYLFDIHTNSFGKQNSTPTVTPPSTFNGYYGGNNGMNIQISANTPATYIKHSSLSLFIGQTTYRTTPSVLHHIFNVICNIEIVEVEVMRKQPCAFFYVYLKNEEELRQCIEKLHKKILFDLHGIWWAQNEEEEEKLRHFVRLEREKMFPVLPLPKQCMVVERRNSIGGPQHGRYAAENLKNLALRQGNSAGMFNMPPMGPMGEMNPYQQQNMYPQMPMPYQNMPSNGYYDAQFPQMPFYPNEMNPYQMNQGYQAPGYPPMQQPMAPAPGFQNPMQPPQAPYPGVPIPAPVNPVDPNLRPKIVIGGPEATNEVKQAETNSQPDFVPGGPPAAPLGQAPHATYAGAPMPVPINPADMYPRPKIVIGGHEAPNGAKPADIQPDLMPGGYAATLPAQPQQVMYPGFPNTFPHAPFEQNQRPKIVITPPMGDAPNNLAGPSPQSTISSQTEPSMAMPPNSEVPLNEAPESADTKKQMLNLCLNPTGSEATEEEKSGDESSN